MNYRRKRMTFFILLVLLACSCSFPSYAKETPDMDRMGSVTVEMKYDGQPVSGGQMVLYRVGDVKETDGSYEFVKTETLQGFSGTLEDIESEELAVQLAEYIGSQNSEERADDSPASSEDTPVVKAAEPVYLSEGVAYFGDLLPGLYLVVQTEAAPGYCLMNPFLVSIPLWENNAYTYDVNAYGKFELEKIHQESKEPGKPKTPGTPVGEKLPQTGQLNWPIPVLACAGMVLFIIGWVLKMPNDTKL